MRSAWGFVADPSFFATAFETSRWVCTVTMANSHPDPLVQVRMAHRAPGADAAGETVLEEEQRSLIGRGERLIEVNDLALSVRGAFFQV
jgi:hypothetical protein